MFKVCSGDFKSVQGEFIVFRCVQGVFMSVQVCLRCVHECLVLFKVFMSVQMCSSCVHE